MKNQFTKSQIRNQILNNEIKDQIKTEDQLKIEDQFNNYYQETHPPKNNLFDQVINLVKEELASSQDMFTIIVDKLEAEVKQNGADISSFKYAVNENIKIAPVSNIEENEKRPGKYIYYKGIKFAYYYFPNHKNMYLTEKVLHVGIVNKVFYTENWTESVKDFFDELSAGGFPITKFYKLDIALDTVQKINDRIDHFKQFKELFKLKRRIKNTPYYVGDQTISHTFGDRYSDAYYVIYNKSSEIKKKSKYYIKSFHEHNELKGDVERIELRLKGEELKSIDLSLSGLNNLIQSEFLIAIFNIHIDYLTFKDMGKPHHYDGNNKKYPEIRIINTPITDSKNVLRKQMEVVNKEIKNTPTNSKKSALREIFFSALETKNLIAKEFLLFYITQYGMLRYFEKMYINWIHSYSLSVNSNLEKEYDCIIEIKNLVLENENQNTLPHFNSITQF